MTHDDRPNALRFVLFKEEGAFVAVCLERYIGAQGNTMEEAQNRLRTAYRAELNDSLAKTGKPFGGIPRAPKHFHDMWETGAHDVTRGDIFDKEGQPPALALAA
ncbi:MAG: hypothetical protein OXH59_03090 [Rhodospirillaceae bacterium]|nr:hypothetical protein [Rhodospirillaceae bacterium]